MHLFPAHRALPDAEALGEIFMHPAMADLITSLPIRPVTEQLEKWQTQKQMWSLKQSLHLSDAWAKHLITLNLSYQDLYELRASHASDEVFQNILQKRGVQSKPLRQKLTAAIPPL